MKERDLKYLEIVSGRKPHWIFKQDNRYYVMTEMEEDSRGNFYVVDQMEVDRVRKELTDKSIPQAFYCGDIFGAIRGIRGGEQLKRENKDYYISRLRSVCYVLAGLGLLGIMQEGRKYLFVKQKRL